MPGDAQPASHAGDIPQSLRVEHNDTLEQLAVLARRHGPVGVEAAQGASILFKKHLQREEEYHSAAADAAAASLPTERFRPT